MRRLIHHLFVIEFRLDESMGIINLILGNVEILPCHTHNTYSSHFFLGTMPRPLRPTPASNVMREVVNCVNCYKNSQNRLETSLMHHSRGNT